MAQLYVSIGSNLDRERCVRRAVAELRREFGPLVLSPVYESSAVGFDGPPFYNLVAGFATPRSPEAVIDVLHGIERALGRAAGDHGMCSRNIDLDLLTYDDLVRTTAEFELPREEIERYAFVLGPLADLAPECRHPVNGRRYAELWAAFDHASQPLVSVPFAWDD
jgi:2-amino-4-hydroxy-6-hydroxymethyldihydropteridine diphosphokinase